MQGFKFTPEAGSDIEVPHIEDARADYAPYWGEIKVRANKKRITDAQAEVSQELSKLGAIPVRFVEGVFENGAVKRYGFEIFFMYGGLQGVLRVAGLPMRTETEIKAQAVKVQALKIVRDWLKAAVTAKVFSPGNDPLLGNILLPDGSGRTVSDYILEQGDLPMLQSPVPEIVVE